MKQYIGSQEHWEDSINADFYAKMREEKEQQWQIDAQLYKEQEFHIFMEENGLGDEDMINDITYPHEL